MESTTALMFLVVGASMGLFGMVLLVMIKPFQESVKNSLFISTLENARIA